MWDSRSAALINTIIKLIFSCQRESFLWDELHTGRNYSKYTEYTQTEPRHGNGSETTLTSHSQSGGARKQTVLRGELSAGRMSSPTYTEDKKKSEVKVEPVLPGGIVKVLAAAWRWTSDWNETKRLVDRIWEYLPLIKEINKENLWLWDVIETFSLSLWYKTKTMRAEEYPINHPLIQIPATTARRTCFLSPVREQRALTKQIHFSKHRLKTHPPRDATEYEE